MMFFDIMRGMNFLSLTSFAKRNCYEYTRFRKKPKHGSRFLKVNENFSDFNAW